LAAPSSYSLSAVRPLNAVGRQQHFALRRPAAINLTLEDRGIFYARPHGTFQPATGSLIPSDQNTNLS